MLLETSFRRVIRLATVNTRSKGILLLAFAFATAFDGVDIHSIGSTCENISWIPRLFGSVPRLHVFSKLFTRGVIFDLQIKLRLEGVRDMSHDGGNLQVVIHWLLADPLVLFNQGVDGGAEVRKVCLLTCKLRACSDVRQQGKCSVADLWFKFH